MEIERDGWRDLDAVYRHPTCHPRTSRSWSSGLTERLVGHFGADVVEVHLGKNDPSRHEMREVAAACIAHLAPLIDPAAAEVLAERVLPRGTTAGAPILAPRAGAAEPPLITSRDRSAEGAGLGEQVSAPPAGRAEDRPGVVLEQPAGEVATGPVGQAGRAQ